MKNKPKLNQPDIEIITTFSDIDIPESLNVNITIPSDMLKDFINQQSVVDFKRDHVELNLREYGNMKIERDVIIYNDKVFMYTQNLTFSECIKEWEERGYIIELGITHMWISTVDDNTIATFDLSDKCVTTSLFIDYDLSVLITKTLKALEEMKDE